MEGSVRNVMSSSMAVVVFLLIIGSATQISAYYATCSYGPCKLMQLQCPSQCPELYPTNPNSKACYLDCYSPVCKTSCKHPRFIGGDGVVFYFHGKANENFALVSDPNLQINARLTGHRPVGRPRDFTWIQALGFLFNAAHTTFTIEASKSATWSNDIDHLIFSHNGKELLIPTGHLSTWTSPDNANIVVQRTSDKNSVSITIPDVAEVMVNVVPVTEEDDRIHGYKVPVGVDCFAHLEVQFKFHGLSEKVDGVLGRTYRLDFENPAAAKPGVAMPVMGGEDEYRTSSLVAADCGACLFDPAATPREMDIIDGGDSIVDCSGRFGGGNGIVCRK
ncbi:hypothetical protein LINGRAHAP2_LOCUS36750 [Linum grandiflorum]